MGRIIKETIMKTFTAKERAKVYRRIANGFIERNKSDYICSILINDYLKPRFKNYVRKLEIVEGRFPEFWLFIPELYLHQHPLMPWWEDEDVNG